MKLLKPLRGRRRGPAARLRPGAPPIRSRGSGRFLFPILPALIMLAACNKAPHYSKPSTPVPPAFKEVAPTQFKEGVGWRVAAPNDDKIRRKWWEMYQDPVLNSLVEQVAISNQTLKQAEANFRASRAVVVQARAALFPTVTGSVEYTNSRFPANSRNFSSPGSASASPVGGTSTSPTAGPGNAGTAVGGGAGGGSGGSGGSVFNTYSLPFDVTYTVDLWHRLRNVVAADVFTAQASAADVATALLSTQAEVAQDYFQIRALDRQRQVFRETIENYQQSLALTLTLYSTGISSGQDVAQAQVQLEAAIAQATDLGVARAQFEHAIATLIGKPAAEFSLEVANFNPNPPPVPVAVPSKLLERRPDIAAAERQVASANAQIGVARAAYYPDLTLSATFGLESTSFADWLTWPSRFWSVGPTLTETLFDGGARRGATEQARANYDAAVANYRQIVLADFQSVEDNLSGLRILADEVKRQQSVVAASSRYLELALSRYKTGIDSYLNVITAQTALLNNRQTEVQIQLRQMTTSVGLILALGGGWDVAELPQPHSIKERPAKTAPGKSAVPASKKVAIPNPPPLK